MAIGRFHNPLKLSTGSQTQEVSIPYGAFFFEGAAADVLAEVNEEGAEMRALDTIVRRMCSIAQKAGAAYRAAGQSPIPPFVTREIATRNDAITHLISITLVEPNGAIHRHLNTLATYDPARDSAEEGTDLHSIAFQCANQIEAALRYAFDSDVVLNISGSIRNTVV